MHAAPSSMGISAGCPVIRDSALESLMLEKVVDLQTETEAPCLLEDRESGHYILQSSAERLEQRVTEVARA